MSLIDKGAQGPTKQESDKHEYTEHPLKMIHRFGLAQDNQANLDK